jgi:hypothetical protein
MAINSLGLKDDRVNFCGGAIAWVDVVESR